jgi:uncharacterized protein with HEPN domain
VETQALYPVVPWGKMKAMRNIIAHAYFHIDLEIIWDTCASLNTLAITISRIIEAL